MEAVEGYHGRICIGNWTNDIYTSKVICRRQGKKKRKRGGGRPPLFLDYFNFLRGKRCPGRTAGKSPNPLAVICVETFVIPGILAEGEEVTAGLYSRIKTGLVASM